MVYQKLASVISHIEDDVKKLCDQIIEISNSEMNFLLL